MLQLFNPLRWARWFADFLVHWCLSLPWRDVAKAIPIMMLMAMLLIGAAISQIGDSGWRNGLLKQRLASALENDNHKAAELLLRRQLETDPENVDVVYELAKARDAQDENKEALELMRRIVDAKSHETAARWILTKEYVGKQWTDLDETQRAEFGRLLELINKKRPDDLGVVQLYADYLIAAEKLRPAVPLLRRLSEYQPMRGLQAAAIQRRLGNFVEADKIAEKTLETVAVMSEEDPTNTVLALAVAQNQLFLKRYQEAVTTLDRAAKRAKTKDDAVRLNQAMGDAIVAWVGFIEESPSQTKNQKLRTLKMLETALQYAPNNPRVLTLVADQILAAYSETDGEISAVRQSLINGSSPGISHFVQGTAALMKDDVDKAMMHLKIAAELMPRSGAILNNLAVAITSRPGGDLKQALKIANTAIKQTPNATPHFYETRGQIHFRMKEYMKAIPDLERALALPELSPNAHEALAVCYTALGEEDLAEKHRIAAAEQSKSKAAPNQ